MSVIWEDFWLAGLWTSDTTPPMPSVSISSGKLSAISGKNSVSFDITANEPFVDYSLRVVPSNSSDRTSGTQIEGGTVSATTSLAVVVTYAEVQAAMAIEGTNIVKAFLKDAAGNWSGTGGIILQSDTSLSRNSVLTHDGVWTGEVTEPIYSWSPIISSSVVVTGGLPA